MAKPQTLTWTVASANARITFALPTIGQSFTFTPPSRRGEITLPPNTYSDVEVIATGRWAITIK